MTVEVVTMLAAQAILAANPKVYVVAPKNRTALPRLAVKIMFDDERIEWIDAGRVTIKIESVVRVATLNEELFFWDVWREQGGPEVRS